MDIAAVLKGILEGLGAGALQNHNVATLGPDFKERQAESAQRVRGSQLAQQLQGFQLQEAGEGLKTEEQQALAMFPQLKDPAQARRMMKVKLAEEARTRAAEEHKVGIDYKSAQAEELRKRPEYKGKTPEEREAALLNILSMIGARDAGVPLAKQRADAYAANVSSQIADRGVDNDRLGKDKKPSSMSPTAWLAFQEKAERKANESLPQGQEQATPEQIKAALDELTRAYEASTGGSPTPSPSPSPGIKPPASAVAAKLYNNGQGQNVPWEQLSPEVQKKYIAAGKGP